MTTLPHICAVCLTYGRVMPLQECIASFLTQTYSGKKSMVVLNTCQEQTLVFEHPEVAIVNLDIRPATLGETRNVAVNLAPEDSLVMNLDDDDVILPNHFNNCVDGFDPDAHQWSWQDKMVFMEGVHITAVKPGAANGFSFLRKAWKTAGGYPHMNSGEDHDFMRRVKAANPGVLVNLDHHAASYVYRWGAAPRFGEPIRAVEHISGLGWDKEGHPTGMDVSKQHLQNRIKIGLEPTGTIALKPGLHIDYAWQLANQLERWRTNWR